MKSIQWEASKERKNSNKNKQETTILFGHKYCQQINSLKTKNKSHWIKRKHPDQLKQICLYRRSWSLRCLLVRWFSFVMLLFVWFIYFVLIVLFVCLFVIVSWFCFVLFCFSLGDLDSSKWFIFVFVFVFFSSQRSKVIKNIVANSLFVLFIVVLIVLVY